MNTQNLTAARELLAAYKTRPNQAAATLVLAAGLGTDYQTAAALVAAILGA